MSATDALQGLKQSVLASYQNEPVNKRVLLADGMTARKVPVNTAPTHTFGVRNAEELLQIYW